MRLIDADALKEIFDGSYCETSDQDVATIIDEQPTIDPVKHGKWIWDDEGYHCSECWYHAYGNVGEVMSGEYRYCPHCGAQMERSEE